MTGLAPIPHPAPETAHVSTPAPLRDAPFVRALPLLTAAACGVGNVWTVPQLSGPWWAAIVMNLAIAAVGFQSSRALRRETAAQDEIARLSERLEITHLWDSAGNKVPFPEGGPDGIECRDATIRLQDEEIDRLAAELAQARGGKA